MTNAALMPLSLLWIGGLWSWLNATMTLHNDSPGYIANGSSLAFGNISFLGASQRPWPVTLLFSIPPDPRIGVALQVLVYLCAWSVFIILWTREMTSTSRLVTSGLLTALALSPVVWQWNVTVLSESLTLSLVLLGLAFGKIAVVSSRHQLGMALLSSSFLGLAAVIKFQLVLVLIAIGLVMLGCLWGSRRFSRGTWVYGLGLISLVLYVCGTNFAMSSYWGQLPSGTERNTINYYFLTATSSANDHITSQLHAALPDEAPDCLKTDRANFGAEEDPYGYQARQIQDCPEGVAWLNQNFASWYAQFLIQNPSYVYRVSSTYIPNAMNFAPYSSVSSLVPLSVAELWMVEQREAWGWKHRFSPFVGWLVIGLVSALVVLSRKHAYSAGLLMAAAYLSLFVSLVVTYLMMNTETLRIGIFLSAPLVATSIVLLVSALGQTAGSVDARGRRARQAPLN